MERGVSLKSIKLTVEYTNDITRWIKLINLVAQAGFEYIQISVILSKLDGKIKYQVLEKLIEHEKSISKDKYMVFSNAIIISHNTRIGYHLLKYLSKNSFEVIYRIDTLEHRKLKQISCNRSKLFKKNVRCKIHTDCEYSANNYTILKKQGIALNKEIPLYQNSEAMTSEFKKWLYDKHGVAVSHFNNAVASFLLGNNGNNCTHNSCLGRTLYLNKDGIICFCPIKPQKTELRNISEVESFEEIFNSNSFALCVDAALKKRETCMVSCQGFKFCQGGCPLLTGNECNNREYMNFMQGVETILKGLDYSDLSVYNPSFKEIYLTSISSL